MKLKIPTHKRKTDIWFSIYLSLSKETKKNSVYDKLSSKFSHRLNRRKKTLKHKLRNPFCVFKKLPKRASHLISVFIFI